MAAAAGIPHAEERALLARLTLLLLDRTTPLGTLHLATRDLFERCTRLGGLAPDGGGLSTRGRLLPQGLALDPANAARCLLDFLRTASFLRGVAAAIGTAHARFGGPVQVLYAGCGPFAPLALPLSTVFTPQQARFTLLDLHAEALDCVRCLVEAWQVGPWLAGVHAADAFEWQPEVRPQVVVVETMQAALAREPQVALMRRLAALLPPGGLMVPEELVITASAVDLQREMGARFAAPPGVSAAPPSAPDEHPVRVDLGTVLRVSAAELSAAPPAAVRLRVPAGLDSARHLVLRTRVRVFEDVLLEDYDSGITYPRVIHEVGRLAAGAELECLYREGATPGFECRLVS